MSELVRDWKAEKKDLEVAFDIISDKLVAADAEIERLKAEETHHIAVAMSLTMDVERNKTLIIELADAWNDPESHPWSYIKRLQQRAREATKDE